MSHLGCGRALDAARGVSLALCIHQYTTFARLAIDANGTTSLAKRTLGHAPKKTTPAGRTGWASSRFD